MLFSKHKRFKWRWGRAGRRRGVALLIALAIMSLLVLLGTAFSLSAIYSAEGARLAAQVIKTRLLMESCTQDALATMSLAFNNPDEPANMMPATKEGQLNKFSLPQTSSAGVVYNRFYWTSQSIDAAGLANVFHHTIKGRNITPPASANAFDSSAGWTQFQDTEGSSAITGRYAFLIIDESGQIDINAALQADSFEGQLEKNSRIGKETKEISLRDVLVDAEEAPLPVEDDAFVGSLQHAGIGGGQLPTGLTWLSWHHLLYQDTIAPANIDRINDPAIFPFSEEIEAFFDRGQNFHRYNLARTDWDSFNNRVPVSGIVADAKKFTETNDGGIPWLKGNTTQTNQIVANMIDFADADSTATTDSTTAPTYVGLERVPYVNEVVFTADMPVDASGAETLTIRAWIELANIYSDALGSDARVTLTFDVVSGQVTYTGQTITWSNMLDTPARSYRRTIPQSWSRNVGNQASLTGFKLTNVTLKYTDSAGNLWDFARFPDMTETTTIDGVSIPVISSEVNDCRHNTPASEWGWLGWGSAGTLGQKNTRSTAPVAGVNNDDEIVNYMGDGDLGTADRINLSTAHVPNRPFQSLWELGAIHRGAAWQTLNIATYNPTAARDGFATYQEGDANLLDQVKLSDKNKVVGKVNINTYSKKVIRGLLASLRLTGDFENPTASTGTLITKARALAVAGTPGALVAGDWLYENGSEPSTGTPFKTRAQLATIVKLKAGGTLGTQDTDAKQEEIIGKIAAFSSTRSNYFTLLLISQTIKDLPTGVQGGTRGEFDTGVDKILAEQRTRVILYRDAYTNAFDVIRYDVFSD